MKPINVPEVIAAIRRSMAENAMKGKKLGEGFQGGGTMSREQQAARDLFQAGRRDYRTAKAAERDASAAYEAEKDYHRSMYNDDYAEGPSLDDIMARQMQAQLDFESRMARAKGNPYWREIQASDPVNMPDAMRDAAGNPTRAGYGDWGYQQALDEAAAMDGIATQQDIGLPFDPISPREWQEQAYMQNYMFAGPKGKLPAAMPPALLAAMLSEGGESSAGGDATRSMIPFEEIIRRWKERLDADSASRAVGAQRSMGYGPKEWDERQALEADARAGATNAARQGNLSMIDRIAENRLFENGLPPYTFGR